MQLFLDIDGVMTSANSWKKPEFMSDGFIMFNPNATRALAKILAQTHADIVLTSSHKDLYNTKEWTELFRNRGIHVKCIKRLPANILHHSRKEEILNWIQIQPENLDFIIIDDDKSLNDLPSVYKERLILTNGLVGLTDDLANQAIMLLTKRKPPISKTAKVSGSKKKVA